MYKDRLGFQCRDEADDLREAVTRLQGTCNGWLAANGRGGWIDDLRNSHKEALALLDDIYNHLDGGAPLYPGSLIFEEDRPAVDVIGNFLRKNKAINVRP